MKYIGLLDIFGFERFEHNSFEQLCINFTNEKLQQFFLTCVFKAEEEIHKAEGVKFVAVEFQDNQGCIDLIEKMPSGILRLLDSQNKTPGGTDAKFFASVNESLKASEFLKPEKTASPRRSLHRGALRWRRLLRRPRRLVARQEQRHAARRDPARARVRVAAAATVALQSVAGGRRRPGFRRQADVAGAARSRRRSTRSRAASSRTSRC